jgi:sugar-specific transcriptional regulator TrmB
MDFSKIEQDLISEIKLDLNQAKVFLLVTTQGKMTAKTISEKLGISEDKALETAKKLMEFGAFIDISKTEFEAMHPRFTSVNMYRKMCERKNIEFKRNKIVDNIGVVLEEPYDNARTK